MPRNPLARAAFDYLCDQSGFSINNATADYPDKKDCGWWYVRYSESWLGRTLCNTEKFYTDDELVEAAKELGFKPAPILDPNHAKQVDGATKRRRQQ